MTNAGLARVTGLTEQTIGNLEAGRTFPDFATMVLVAEAIGEDLVAYAVPPTPKSLQQRRGGKYGDHRFHDDGE